VERWDKEQKKIKEKRRADRRMRRTAAETKKAEKTFQREAAKLEKQSSQSEGGKGPPSINTGNSKGSTKSMVTAVFTLVHAVLTLIHAVLTPF